MMTYSISELIQKAQNKDGLMFSFYLVNYFLYFFNGSCWNSGGNVSTELDLSHYATKAKLKRGTDTDTFTLASKTNFTDLKTKVDYLDIDKLKTGPADLGKLSNAVDNKVNAINTKIPSTSGLVTKTQYDSKSKS